MKKIGSWIMAFACLSIVGCGGQKKETEDNSKVLVLYYSQTGATKAVAEELQKQLQADIIEIEAVEPYDGSYDETIQRCIIEREGNIVPAIKPIEVNLDEYDTIFLGYPVWFGTFARPILGLLAQQDFNGKTIVPFCTFGSGGLEATASDLKVALPKASIQDGYGVRNARISKSPAEISRFLVENNYVEGVTEAQPAYSDVHPVTDEEIAIFDAACGNYQFPLGTPYQVAVRPLGYGMDYKYSVKSAGPDGQEAETIIYVIAPVDGSQPEFTRVVR